MTRHLSRLPRLPNAFHWILVAFVLPGTSTPLSAQTDEDALLLWARENSIPLASVEPGSGFTDLQYLKPLLGSARLVALGEVVHGAHEFLALRNRLFEFLVEELGFTAIAVETGFTEAQAVGEYVEGGAIDGPAAESVFQWTAPEVWSENQQLIDWMRDYNLRPYTSRKIRFYGIDLTGGRRGAFRLPRSAADSALAYLARVDSALADRAHRDLVITLPQFNRTDYPMLETTERNALTAVLADLVSIFEREKLRFVAATGESDYEVAYRQAVVAQKVDAHFRALAASPNDQREAWIVRDQAMAANVQWVMEREGEAGRVLLFAHNWHVKTSPMSPEAYPELFPNRPATTMGEYLRPKLGDEMVVIGTAFGGGEGALDGAYQRADPESVDGLLGRIGPPIFALHLNTPSWSDAARNQFNRYRKVRFGDRYGELDVPSAFDVLIYVDTVTPIRREPAPR